MTETLKIKVETEGFEKAREDAEAIADAMETLPAQIVIKGCRDCTINIYPSQVIGGMQ